ncbi:MAG: HesA/MoeB/ThiF family protein [Sorangiineae bacterium]|nr:HesA/MoeB/ThiF family protein [Polyangiaceae bacterium]MEB2321537.1 HesA/MoeB/ThiF family protein [Sorangiineae bacterium]
MLRGSETSSGAAPADRERLRRASALVIGAGGLGCPAALALVRAGVGRVVLADDDQVELTNLHRQILFSDDDVGADKLDAAARALDRERTEEQRIELVRSRFLPENARALARDADIVLEGADNFATKFLAADACALEHRPVVHGAGIRWLATALSVAPGGRPCYRCLFEDLPGGDAAPNCATAGVMGPVVGFAGALMADLALSWLTGDDTRAGRIFTFDGWRERLREVPITPRADCALCGPRPRITRLDEALYLGDECRA